MKHPLLILKLSAFCLLACSVVQADECTPCDSVDGAVSDVAATVDPAQCAGLSLGGIRGVRMGVVHDPDGQESRRGCVVFSLAGFCQYIRRAGQDWDFFGGTAEGCPWTPATSLCDVSPDAFDFTSMVASMPEAQAQCNCSEIAPSGVECIGDCALDPSSISLGGVVHGFDLDLWPNGDCTLSALGSGASPMSATFTCIGSCAEPGCGNGIRESNEECDPGIAGDGFLICYVLGLGDHCTENCRCAWSYIAK